MPSRRTVLLILALLVAIGTGFLAFSDVRYEDQNCGAALLPNWSTKASFDTGDPIEDELLEETSRVECGHRLARQRYGVFVGALISGLLWYRARQLKLAVSPFGTGPGG